MKPASEFRSLREKAGLSIEEAAQRLGVGIRTVYGWEAGRPVRKVYRDRLETIAAERLPAQPTAHFRFVDFFAGIGGMRLAFEAVGGECVATCEWNKYARVTYAANFPTARHPFYEDINDVTRDVKDIRGVPDHDILVAGFPCQPFSIAGVSKKNALGRAHGFACEAQGTLFFELAKILEAKRPKAFLLENVKNLVSHDRGNTFRVIMDVLRRDLGYKFVDYRVLDAKGFVPQHRERTIIVGFREEAGFSWEDVSIPPVETGPRMGAVLHSADEKPDGVYTTGKTRARVHPKYTLTDHLWSYLKNYAAKHRAAGNGFGFGLVGPDSVARTLSARYYKDGSEILVDQGKARPPRRLTPRECARLMGFDRPGRPFKVENIVSDTQAYKQFGNAVVVPVIEAVARAMVPCLRDMDTANTEPKLPLFRYRPGTAQAHA